MTRHGLSHGTATLVTVVAAGLLTEHARQHLPLLARALDGVSAQIYRTGWIKIPQEALTPLLLGSLLAVLWGVAFAVITGSRSRS